MLTFNFGRSASPFPLALHTFYSYPSDSFLEHCVGLFLITHFLTCVLDVSLNPLSPRNSQIVILGFLKLQTQATFRWTGKVFGFLISAKIQRTTTAHLPQFRHTRKTLKNHLCKGRNAFCGRWWTARESDRRGDKGPHLCLCRSAEQEQPAHVHCRPAPAKAGTLTKRQCAGAAGGQKQCSRSGGRRGGWRWQRERLFVQALGVEVYVREAPAEREPGAGVLGHRYLPLRSRAGKIRDVPAGGDVEGWGGGPWVWSLIPEGRESSLEKARRNRGVCLTPPPRGSGDVAAAACRALTQQSGNRDSSPRAGTSLLPRVTAAPTWGREAAAALPPSAPRPRGLPLIFPAGKRRAADKGMPVVSCLFCWSLRWARGTWGVSGRQRPGLFCLGLRPPVWYKSASLGAARTRVRKPQPSKRPLLAPCRPRTTFASPLLESAGS